jgi:peptidoglycan/LPS O-acetylase OafA/YrhL
MPVASTAERISGNHIPALDGIRGVSAFLVFAAHTGLLPRQYGALGVSVFFVLSGFLITWLLLREAERTGAISLKAFYVRRTLRIFPAFYAFWIVCILVTQLRGVKIPWPETISSFFYMGDYYNALKSPISPPGIMGITWSLGVEEKFYLIWPWLFMRHFHERRKLIRIVLGGIAAVWSYRIIAVLCFAPREDYLRYAFESRWDNLMYGCLLALFLNGVPIAKWTVRSWSPFLCVFVLTISVFLEEKVGSAYHYLFGMSLDAIVISILLGQLIFLSNTLPWSFLEMRLSRFFGRISYSFYLYHLTAILLVQQFLPAQKWSVQLIAAMMTATLFAALSHRWIERPFLRLKEYYSKSRERTLPIPLGAIRASVEA